ncbi:hypothetical protein ACZ87_00016 [Candidatus Erwinia dacicola]|uniref:Uncharacterized protein n=1 Tax=Candidatus Erwinia dacicola TaxID=252393 RepID=A0A328TZG0_9GAMM|nr:hypothetical protein ACZ87_00016 [Candidatus Erwinia dacicola]
MGQQVVFRDFTNAGFLLRGKGSGRFLCCPRHAGDQKACGKHD